MPLDGNEALGRRIALPRARRRVVGRSNVETRLQHGVGGRLFLGRLANLPHLYLSVAGPRSAQFMISPFRLPWKQIYFIKNIT